MGNVDLVEMIITLVDSANPISVDRHDWEGMSAVLKMYDRSSGAERAGFISALDTIFRQASARPETIAQLVHFASALDISELEPAVRTLQKKPEVEANETLKQAIRNYLAYRGLARSQKAGA